jgi:tetratricopeptide (TPR) repeat protein
MGGPVSRPEPEPPAPGAGAGEPFVDRNAELARLQALLDQALSGAGALALITGEAGVGKTALAGEALRRARQSVPSFVLCRGRCVEQFGKSEAYLPFLDALGTLLVGRGREPTAQLLRRYAPTWCSLLPAIGDAPDFQTIGATKERMLREMGDVLEAAGSESLMVAFLEDVQWADPSSADLVRHLLNRIARQRILLIGTVRPGELQTPDHPLRGFLAELRAHKLCHEIPLGPLGKAAVAGLLEARFPRHRFPPELAERIHHRTEGHPFFVTSLMDLLLDRGDIVSQGGGWSLARQVPEIDFDAPESARALVRRKIEALDDTDRLALQYASVTGREFLSTVLARLLDVDEMALEERFDKLDRAHRLIDTRGEEELPGGGLATRYRFSHSLYQEVLYEDLVTTRRIKMHQQVGHQLVACYGAEAPRLAASLAFHFERGRDFPAAIDHLAYAADNAARLSAHGQAEEHFARALAMVEKLPAEQRGERLVGLHQKLGAARLATSRFVQAEESFTEMLDVARSLEKPALEGMALAGLCNALFFSRRIEEMAVRAVQTLQAAERAGSTELQIEAMLMVAQVLQEDGSLTDCKNLLDEVLALAGPGPTRARLAGLVYRGVVHYWQSEYDLAEDRLTEALALASELRDGLMVLISLQFLGLARGNRGRMSQALAALTEGKEMGLRNGDRFWLPRLASHIGWIHRELQDFDGAIHHDLEGLSIAREHGVVSAEASALLNLSFDYTQAGQLDAARETLERLENEHSHADWFGWLYTIRLEDALAEHWLARGQPSRAAEHASRLLEIAGPRQASTYIASAHRILFEAAHATGDVASAVAHVDAALAELRSHPAPLYAWRLHGAIAQLRAGEGDRAGAHVAYVDAAGVIRRLASGIDDADLRGTFLASPAVRTILAGEAEA